MKTKLVTRFYCDHCGKGRFHKAAMLRHESACIRNPQRRCPLCEEVKLDTVPMPELIAAFDERHADDLTPLRQKASGCPACMLAAIVQARERWRDADDKEWITFSYKDEKAAWYRDMQQDREGNMMAPAFLL